MTVDFDSFSIVVLMKMWLKYSSKNLYSFFHLQFDEKDQNQSSYCCCKEIKTINLKELVELCSNNKIQFRLDKRILILIRLRHINSKCMNFKSYSITLINQWRDKQTQAHCVKSVQIRSFFWSVFSRIRARKNSVFLRCGIVLDENYHI